jgi:hypothetical protein
MQAYFQSGQIANMEENFRCCPIAEGVMPWCTTDGHAGVGAGRKSRPPTMGSKYKPCYFFEISNVHPAFCFELVGNVPFKSLDKLEMKFRNDSSMKNTTTVKPL